MKHLIHKSFFKRNTKDGVNRYLSGLGMDYRKVNYIPAHNRDHVYATDENVKHFRPLSELEGLPHFTMTLLEGHGFHFIGQLVSASDDELLALNGIKDARLIEIRTALEGI